MVFVMGGGKFGTNALNYLKGKAAKVLVVDINPDCMASSKVDIQAEDLNVCDSLETGQSAFLKADAVQLLTDMLEIRVPNLVVTAIPGNAVAKVVDAYLAKRKIMLEPCRAAVSKVLVNLPESLVSFVDKDLGVIVVSYMPSCIQCRDNCVPPKNVCTVTGRPKLASMTRLLEFGIYDLLDVSAILCSPQLTGGLGAIEGKDLHALLKNLDGLEVPYTLAVGTACDCHGILNLSKAT